MKAIAAIAAVAFFTAAADAQTTAGAGTVVVIPVVANIPGAYQTRIVVRNVMAAPITLTVRYYRSNSASLGAGAFVCTPLSVPATSGTSNGTASFDLATQCGFGVSDDFGMLFLEDSAVPKTNLFAAYSRTQFAGVGFSVEGFPAGNFSSAPAEVIGLRSTADGHNKVNCFVGALGEPVNYQIRLFNTNGAPVVTPFGDPIAGFLNAYETVRFLAVLPGDVTDARAAFSVTSGAAYIGFCTQETDVGGTGSADFRIAKSIDARDARQQRVSCYGQDDCNVASVNNAAQIADTSLRNIHYVILDQPDFVGCTLIGSRIADLEMQLRQPGDPLNSLPFPTSGPPYSSGGHGLTSFYIDTGPRSTIAQGFTTRWYIDVQWRAGGNPTTPIPYGITCISGNGTSVPWIGTTNVRF